MKTYLSKLNPTERRFVVGVGLVFFLVINIFWVWPHFSDWNDLQTRLAAASSKIALYQSAFQQTNTLAREVERMQRNGADVPPEDQSVQFLRTIQNQSAQSGVAVTSNGRQITRTNQFFIEQIQTITVQAGEPQLVDFLYRLGTGDSLVRVRDLSIRPDQNHQQLVANITLIASYQKNPKAHPAAATPAPAPASRPAAIPAPATGPVTVPPHKPPGRTNAPGSKPNLPKKQ